MIIAETREAPSRDLARFAWAGLKRFLNEEFVTEMLRDLHSVDRQQLPNVRKQARQIRYCVMQAREYATAAEGVSLVTQPTLYYYSIMCLALAEILLKQSGESSLDRARAEHRHHGLEFRVGPATEPQWAMVEANRLRAVPASKGERRFGTFELWHQSSREVPIVGDLTTQLEGMGVTHQQNIILGAKDALMPPVPSAGLSLLDVLVHLPQMAEHLDAHRLVSQLIRTTVTAIVGRDNLRTTQILIHPGPGSMVRNFMANCQFEASITAHFQPIGTGGHLSWKQGNTQQIGLLAAPHGCTLGKSDVRFWVADRPLNEFGYFYVALFIAGNYARYYPDKWINDVERHTPLALAIEELLRCAVERVPLLALSELSRKYYVPGD